MKSKTNFLTSSTPLTLWLQSTKTHFQPKSKRLLSNTTKKSSISKLFSNKISNNSHFSWVNFLPTICTQCLLNPISTNSTRSTKLSKSYWLKMECSLGLRHPWAKSFPAKDWQLVRTANRAFLPKIAWTSKTSFLTRRFSVSWKSELPKNSKYPSIGSDFFSLLKENLKMSFTQTASKKLSTIRQLMLPWQSMPHWLMETLRTEFKLQRTRRMLDSQIQ